MQRTLAILISGSLKKYQSSNASERHQRKENGQEKTEVVQSTVVLITTLRKEDIEKGLWKSGQNPLNVKQYEDLPIKRE